MTAPAGPAQRGVSRRVLELCLQRPVSLTADTHRRMVAAAIAAQTAANRIAVELDRIFPHVAQARRFGGKERMLARRGNQDEEAAVPQVLHVGQAHLLAPTARPFRPRNAVAREELRIDRARIFVVRDGSAKACRKRKPGTAGISSA